MTLTKPIEKMGWCMMNQNDIKVVIIIIIIIIKCILKKSTISNHNPKPNKVVTFY